MTDDLESSESREGLQNITVEAWDTARIDLGNHREVSLDVNQDKLQDYLRSKLTPPLAPNAVTNWKYLFDDRRKISANNSDYIGGLTIYKEGIVLIDVRNLWQSLVSQNQEELLREILKTVAHETNHVKQFLNADLQTKAEKDKKPRNSWGELGKALGLGISTFDGLVAGKLLSQKMNRRNFLKLLGGAAAGFAVGTMFSDTLKQGAFSVFDHYIDDSHKDCYAAEAKWEELKGVITIKDIV